MLSAAALLLHASLLGGIGWAWPDAEPAGVPAAAMWVRTVVTEPPVPVVMPESPAPPKARPIRKPVIAKPSAVAEPAPTFAGPPAAQQLALADAPTAKANPAPHPPGDDEAVPVYKTRMPPAATLRFRMQRGGLHGTADLSWRPTADRYELRLDGKLMGLTLISQSSTGSFDSAGIAPVRFTDQRVRGETRAANFQREAAKITFSGPSDEFTLWAGVQDRLSWMVQLPAIVAGDPRLATPGARVAMHVVGARADAAVWTLRFVNRESVEAADGLVQALKFVREPQGPYDTSAEIWLDPNHHFMPVRATLRSGFDSEPLELILQETAEGP